MKKILIFLLTITLLMTCSCSNNAKKSEAGANICILTGPTGIGLISLTDQSINTNTDDYTFTVLTSPDMAVAKLNNGEADVVSLPTNLAAKIYAMTQGSVQILCVTNGGAFSILSNNDVPVESLQDLKGKTLYTTGKGSNPEFVLNYIFEKNGLSSTDIQVEYMPSPNDLVTVFQTDKDAYIMAPQPVASSILSKFSTSSIVIDVQEEWENAAKKQSLLTGCLVAKKSFIENNQSTIQTLLQKTKDSIIYANTNLEHCAELCELNGIIANKQIAQKAIPLCNLAYVDGEEMQEKLNEYFAILYSFDQNSIGEIPNNDIYYKK